MPATREKRFVSHGGDIWGFSRKHNIPVEEVLEFSGPINFMGPPPKAVEAVKEHARLIKFYPDPNPVEFKKTLADYVGQGIKAENVLIGNGSIELIYMITELFEQNFDAIIPVPSFSEYEKATLRSGGKITFVQLPADFSLENAKIKEAISPDTKIMCLCNPHSPSGRLYKKPEIMELVEFCQKKDIIFSIDENYIEFAPDGQQHTVAGMVQKYENLFVIRSVTKFYGMAGLRLGYALAASSLIEKLETIRQPWSINGLACQVTQAALNDQEFTTTTKETINKNKEQLTNDLNQIKGLQVYPSTTNFLLIKLTNPNLTSTSLKEQLAKQRILIRDCSTFMGMDNKHIRITVRSTKDNNQLVEKIKQIIDCLGN
ncbi:histidinol-phosphate transaminase [Candidatus Bathycorpusculum sp.]|uniref:pyridoxal phosphate-dependent aminotransferase n=1 Tax=Candidatus Bathycorpusculum sp. TaxID=2994959 RepID=UPI00282D99AF|nr:histidinol-phosphate aminotransferase family protein [Candidatus Termitimicrobium sp.]MCL2686633.1 histidinol-phosphate aminotransferase family protein [Candidatus Termitimicrobium sp.]